MEKFRLMGIGGKLLSWLKSFLTEHSQKVMVNSHLSEKISVSSGVPQGSVLGPLFFLILISDIDKDILDSFISSLADIFFKGDYWTRLKTLCLYSQERCRERYRIVYIWKVLENLVPMYSNIAELAHYLPIYGESQYSS